MTVFNPFFVLIALLVAFLTAWPLSLVTTQKTGAPGFETLDGLRGFLAISVFIHHAAIWYNYLHTGTWTDPKSDFFNQLGQVGVAFFFMISAFLFVNKLLVFKGDSYNWRSFFMKRFFRLVPLHFFAVGLILLVVFIQSNWELQTGFGRLVKDVLKWLGFGVLGLGDINNVDTTPINAGVLWSLSYEWLLYFSLPVVSLFLLKTKPKPAYILMSVAFIVITSLFSGYEYNPLLSFAGGAFAAGVVKYRKKTNVTQWGGALLILICLVMVFRFHSSDSIWCKLLITLAFTLIAFGNDFFGVLKNPVFKLLGEISYSTYLLHGIIIFVSIQYVYGLEKAKSLSETGFCILMFTITAVVVMISFLTHRFIERPFMKKG